MERRAGTGMKRHALNAGRVLLALIAVVGAVALVIVGLDASLGGLALAALLLLVPIGVLTNRHWVAVVPLVLAAAFAIWIAIVSAGDGYSDPPPELWIMLALALGVGCAAGVLVGVRVRREVRRIGRERRGRS